MAGDVPMIESFRGVMSLLVSDIVRIAVPVAFPVITLGLVNLRGWIAATLTSPANPATLRAAVSAAAAGEREAGSVTIHVGVGGWNFAPWRQTFYPEGLRQKDELAFMASQLSAVEVNGTFYRTQTTATFRGWHDATPDGFVFTLKAPRYATNRKVLAEAGESIARFTDSGIAELGPKLGPVLWQFAPTKRFEAEDFAAFLDLLPGAVQGLPLRHAVEVRHPSFAVPEFVALARSRGVAIVLAGDSDYPAIPDATADFAYLRIMGTEAGHKAGYAPKALDLWAARARAIAAGEAPEGIAAVADAAHGRRREVFLFVISGEKPLNPLAALALRQRLS